MNRRLHERLARAIVLSALTFSLILAAPTVSWAADSSNNQAINQVASLIAPEADTKITIYLRPEVGKAKAGYGIDGDLVTVLEQVSDNQRLIWHHIRFDNPPYAEGWVQETFLSIEAPAASQGQNQQVGSSPLKNRYLGNQQSQSSQGIQSSQSSQGIQSNQRSQSNQGTQSNQMSQSNPYNSPQSYSQRNQN